jgi:protein-S-isoprenylcysteine O-methyltransferase Ste14
MTADTPDLIRRSMRSTAVFLVAMAVMLFLPAWTLRYWQAWLFLIVFSAICGAGTLYFIKHDPALIERRLSVGPGAEKEASQKIIMTAASVCIVLLYVVPGLDRHFGWSHVPPALVVLGDIGVLLGFLGIFRVFKENSYASATVEIGKEQRVIDTGPYAFVRHPMYTAALLMFAATPLALGSCWALLLIIPLTGVLAWRLSDEERFLIRNLPGYAAYRQRTRYRLIPWVWRRRRRSRRRHLVDQAFSIAVSIGNERMRFPVAAKIALHSAGITGGSIGSPRPVGELFVVTKCTSTGGACISRKGSKPSKLVSTTRPSLIVIF